MNRNILWGMIVVLLVTNALTFSLFKTNKTDLNKNQPIKESIPTSASESNEKIIAKVGEENLTYSEMISGLEKKYGTEYLNTILDQEVVFQLAKQEGISISEDEVNKEIDMFKAVYHEGVDLHSFSNEKDLHREVKYMLTVEELLTKDIVIPDGNMKKYYETNKEMFDIPMSYRISHIVVKTKAEIDEVIKELNNGSSFSVIAMERSTDVFSASEGGELGYVTRENNFVSEAYFKELDSLKEDTWSPPIQVEDGYAVVYLHELLEGKAYSFDEVKSQIRRQLALQQTEGSLSVKALWNEIGVEVFYEGL